jgi:hypothetical protein
MVISLEMILGGIARIPTTTPRGVVKQKLAVVE